MTGEDRFSAPPSRSPIYAEPLLGDEAFLEPAQALQLFCHQLKAQFEISRHWKLGNLDMECIEAVLRDGGLSCTFLCRDNRMAANLTARMDSDWIRLDVDSEAANATFYVERVYENWEVWPPRAIAEGEAPGQIGKRMHWAQVDTTAWPDLKDFSETGFLLAEAVG